LKNKRGRRKIVNKNELKIDRVKNSEGTTNYTRSEHSLNNSDNYKTLDVMDLPPDSRGATTGERGEFLRPRSKPWGGKQYILPLQEMSSVWGEGEFFSTETTPLENRSCEKNREKSTTTTPPLKMMGTFFPSQL